MNKVLMTGRWTDDPKIYTSAEGMKIAKGTIAVKRRYKKEGYPDADFVHVVAFGDKAEHIEKYYHKGMKADIEGRIQTGSHEDADGKKIYDTDVVIENIEFGESKSAQSQSGIVQDNVVKEGGFIEMDDKAIAEAEQIFNF